jgi:hypothetical protein
MRFGCRFRGWPLCAWPHDDHQRNRDRRRAHPRDPRSAGFWLRLLGSFDLESFRHAARSQNDAGPDNAERQARLKDGVREKSGLA